MSVHLQIAEQVKNHRSAQKEFLKLDEKREKEIEVLLKQAKMNQSFTLQKVNQITDNMNKIALQFQFPTRKIITTEMVLKEVQGSNH